MARRSTCHRQVVVLMVLLLCGFRRASCMALPDDEDDDADGASSPLLDLPDFRYVHIPTEEGACGSEGSDDDVLFLILISSRPSDFDRRALVRETWGSVRDLGQGRKIRLAFLMGSPRDPEPRAKAADLNQVDLLYPRKWKFWNARAIGSAGSKAAAVGGDEGQQKVVLVQREAEAEGSKSALQRRVDEEAKKFGDILQGNFVDSARNASYKDLMGYRWLREAFAPSDGVCGGEPRFVLRSSDDVFVEVFHLAKFVSAIYGDSPGRRRLLVCDVVPNSKSAIVAAAAVEGAKKREDIGGTFIVKTEDETTFSSEPSKNPRNEDDASTITSSSGSTSAPPTSATTTPPSSSEPIKYPEHCSNTAYLITPDLAADFLDAAEKVRRPLHDVSYVTGHLRSHLGVSPFYLNLRYTRDLQPCLRWLQGRTTLPLPYLFASLNQHDGRRHPQQRQDRWQEIYRRLWNKTVRIHQKRRE